MFSAPSVFLRMLDSHQHSSHSIPTCSLICTTAFSSTPLVRKNILSLKNPVQTFSFHQVSRLQHPRTILLDMAPAYDRDDLLKVRDRASEAVVDRINHEAKGEIAPSPFCPLLACPLSGWVNQNIHSLLPCQIIFKLAVAFLVAPTTILVFFYPLKPPFPRSHSFPTEPP